MSKRAVIFIVIALIVLYLYTRRDLWQPMVDGVGPNVTPTARGRATSGGRSGSGCPHPEVEAERQRMQADLDEYIAQRCAQYATAAGHGEVEGEDESISEDDYGNEQPQQPRGGRLEGVPLPPE
jgi:hypothetical protein